MKRKYLTLLLALLILSWSFAGIADAQQEKKYFFGITITTYPAKLQYVQYMQPYIEQLGIKVDIESTTYASSQDLIYHNTSPKSEGGWDVYGGTWIPRQPLDLSNYLSSAGIWPEGVGNYYSYNSGTADRLQAQINAETDPAKQKELLNQFQQVVYDAHPVIPVYNTGGLQVYSKGVLGIDDFSAWSIPADDFIYPSIYTSIPGKDTFTVAGAYQLDTFCPLLPMGYFGWSWSDGPIKVAPSGEIIPSLAESWEFSQDGLTLTFHLRHEPIVWSDGVPFTSKDVKFTYEAIMNKDLGAQLYTQFNDVIQSIDTPDDYTVVLNLKTVYTPILYLLTTPTGVWMVPEHTLKDIPVADWLTHPLFTTGIGLPSLGPYQMDSLQTGLSWTFKTNELWWGWKNLAITPPYKQFVFKYIPEKTVALAATQTGEINEVDYYYHFEEQFPTIKSSSDLQYNIVSTALSEGFHINLNHPALANKYVRAAINLALPRGEYVKTILNGIGKPLAGIMPYKYSEFVNPNIPEDPYDMAKAKSLMEQAGYHYADLETKPPDYGTSAMFLVVGLVVGIAATFLATRITRKKA